MGNRIIWQPQERQRAFLSRPEYEVLYGGAAGGGKSDAILVDALRQVNIPHYTALVLRKSYPQLRELIDRSLELYLAICPAARYNATEHRWRFPSGASIIFGSINNPRDVHNYQGHAYDTIYFDELTHFTFDEYSYLFSRNRPTGAGTRVYIRATTNPSGIGHGWVKDRFISAAPPMTTIYEDVDVPMPDGTTKRMTRDRIFVPATIFDNPILLNNDPNYLASLAMLPEAEKQALLYGSWDSFDGQVFTEWVNDPRHYDDQRWTHVIDPFEIDERWSIYRCFDFGYSRPFAVEWAAVDTDGRIYIINEYYGCDGTPNKGIKMEPTEIAREIKRIESEHPLLKGKHVIGIADPAIFAEDRGRGQSIAGLMESAPNFVTFTRGDHNRIAGKMQMHYRFAFDKEGRPMMQVFKTCKHFIRTIPSLVYSESHVEDVDTEQEDHIYDAVRYLCMARPITPRRNEAIVRPDEDPLDQFVTEDDKYAFYRL